METMKTSIENLINSGVITAETMVDYMLREKKLDYELVEKVYTVKRQWLYCYGYVQWGATAEQKLYPVTELLGCYNVMVYPLFVALIKCDERLERLLLDLGACEHTVAMMFFSKDEIRSVAPSWVKFRVGGKPLEPRR